MSGSPFDAQRPDTIKNIRTWSDELSPLRRKNDAIWQTFGRYVWPNPIFYDTYEQEVEYLVIVRHAYGLAGKDMICKRLISADSTAASETFDRLTPYRVIARELLYLC